jgi:hypothetical protein
MPLRAVDHFRSGEVDHFQSGGSSCNGQADPSSIQSPQDVQTITEDLFFASGANAWPNGQVRVCFVSGQFTQAQQDAIHLAAEESWERAAKINFWGWDTCPTLDANTSNLVALSVDASLATMTPPLLGIENNCSDGTIASCKDLLGQARSGDFNRVRFVNATPTNAVVIHELGHALGFLHEFIDDGGCNQRTTGDEKLTGQGDLSASIMALKCNGVGNLSAWDIMGARRKYGLKPPGSLVGMGGLSLNIKGADATPGTPLVGWPAFGDANDSWSRPTNALTLQANLPAGARCANVSGGSVSNNFTPLISWTCDVAAQNERFSFGGMQWRAMGNMCVQADSASQNSELSLQNCSSSNSLQAWDFFSGDKRIRLFGTNLCVNVPNDNTNLGTRLILWPCNATGPAPNETFVYSKGAINYKDKCFDVLGGTTTTGNKIGLWDGCGAVPLAWDKQFSIRGRVKVMGQCLNIQGAINREAQPIGAYPCASSMAINEDWEYFW